MFLVSNNFKKKKKKKNEKSFKNLPKVFKKQLINHFKIFLKL